MADNTLKLAFILSATDKMSRIVDEAVKKSTDKLSAFERSTGKAARSMMKAGTIMMGTGAAIGGAMVGIAKASADYAGAIKDTSEATGIDTTALQKMAYAAKISGIEREKLSTSMIKFDKVLADAAGGSKTAAQTFKDLGINIKDASGKMRAPNEIFEDVAEIFHNTEDGATKTALACELFGKSGAELMPMLNEGKNGLKGLYEAAEKSGNVLGSDALTAVDEFGKKMDAVGLQVKGLGLQVGASLTPIIHNLLNRISGIIEKVSGWMQRNPQLAATIGKVAMVLAGLLITVGVASVVFGALTFMVGKFATVFRGVSTAVSVGTTIFKSLKTTILVADRAMKGYTISQKVAAIATRLFNQALKANPIMTIISLIIALGTAVYFVIKNWDKIKAFFTKLWAKVVGIFKQAWENIKTSIANAWESIKGLFSSLNPVEWMRAAWGGVGAFFGSLGSRFYEWGKNILEGLWNGVTSKVTKIIEGVKNIANKIAKGFKAIFGINSPSKLFAEYGQNITQGLVVGIDQGGGAVENATASMAAHTMGGVTQYMQSNTMNTSNLVNGSGSSDAVLNYSPQITITGAVTPEMMAEFSKLLKQHANDIISIIQRNNENKARLSFNV